MEIHGEINLKTMIAQVLQMGDEGHNRNKAGTSLLIREIAPAIVATHFSQEEKRRTGFIAVVAFITHLKHQMCIRDSLPLD